MGKYVTSCAVPGHETTDSQHVLLKRLNVRNESLKTISNKVHDHLILILNVYAENCFFLNALFMHKNCLNKSVNVRLSKEDVKAQLQYSTIQKFGVGTVSFFVRFLK